MTMQGFLKAGAFKPQVEMSSLPGGGILFVVDLWPEVSGKSCHMLTLQYALPGEGLIPTGGIRLFEAVQPYDSAAHGPAFLEVVLNDLNHLAPAIRSKGVWAWRAMDRNPLFAPQGGVKHGVAVTCPWAELAEGDRQETLRRIGVYVARHGYGRWTVGEDSGFNHGMLTAIDKACRAELGDRLDSKVRFPVAGVAGDPSPVTAEVGYAALEAAVEAFFQERTSVSSLSFAVKGLGGVGRPFAEKLLRDGAKRILVADLNGDVCEAVRAMAPDRVEVVDPEKIYLDPEVDVFCPIARGNDFDPVSVIPILQARNRRPGLILPLANCPFWEPQIPWVLKDQGVEIVPAELCNCGGLLTATAELMGAPGDIESFRSGVAKQVRALFLEAALKQTTLQDVADRHVAASILELT